MSGRSHHNGASVWLTAQTGVDRGVSIVRLRFHISCLTQTTLMWSSDSSYRTNSCVAKLHRLYKNNDDMNNSATMPCSVLFNYEENSRVV